MPPLLIYIHGFISSPLSEKAGILRQFVRDTRPPIDLAVPELSNHPRHAHAQLQAQVELEHERGREQIALIGSSLGGFWATLLAERFGLRAALINPAVRPHLHAQLLLGDHENMYTGERFTLTGEDVEALSQLTPSELKHPENLWLLVQTSDETLDYRQAVTYYQRAKQTVEAGGSHGFEEFGRHLPEIFDFLSLPTS